MFTQARISFSCRLLCSSQKIFAVPFAELVCQMTALVELEDVVLGVEDGDPVHELEHLCHGGDELVLVHHAARILRVYTGSVFNPTAPGTCV